MRSRLFASSSALAGCLFLAAACTPDSSDDSAASPETTSTGDANDDANNAAVDELETGPDAAPQSWGVPGGSAPEDAGLSEPNHWLSTDVQGIPLTYRRASQYERDQNGWADGTFLIESSSVRTAAASGSSQLSIPIPIWEDHFRIMEFDKTYSEQGPIHFEMSGSTSVQVTTKTPTFHSYRTPTIYDEGEGKHRVELDDYQFATLLAESGGHFIASGVFHRETAIHEIRRIDIKPLSKIEALEPSFQQDPSDPPRADISVVQWRLPGSEVDLNHPPDAGFGPSPCYMEIASYACATNPNGGDDCACGVPSGPPPSSWPNQCLDDNDNDSDGSRDNSSQYPSDFDIRCEHSDACRHQHAAGGPHMPGAPFHGHSTETGLDVMFLGDMTFCSRYPETWSLLLYRKRLVLRDAYRYRGDHPAFDALTGNPFEDTEMLRHAASKCWITDLSNLPGEMTMASNPGERQEAVEDRIIACHGDLGSSGGNCPPYGATYPYVSIDNPSWLWFSQTQPSIEDDIAHTVGLTHGLDQPIDIAIMVSNIYWTVSDASGGQKDGRELGGLAPPGSPPEVGSFWINHAVEWRNVSGSSDPTLGEANEAQNRALAVHELGHGFGCLHDCTSNVEIDPDIATGNPRYAPTAMFSESGEDLSGTPCSSYPPNTNMRPPEPVYGQQCLTNIAGFYQDVGISFRRFGL